MKQVQRVQASTLDRKTEELLEKYRKMATNLPRAPGLPQFTEKEIEGIATLMLHEKQRYLRLRAEERDIRSGYVPEAVFDGYGRIRYYSVWKEPGIF